MASQALTALVGISIFLAYGTTAAVARQLGAGQREAAIRQGIDGLWLAGIIGAVVLAAGWPLAPQIVHAFDGSPGVSREAAAYLRISLLGAPSMLAVLAGTGVLRGLQDTRTPLTVAVAANVLNVARNAFPVLGLHWGIAGSAWGTVCAQTAAAAAYLAMVALGARRAGMGFAPGRSGLRAAAVTGVSLVVRTIALQAVLIVVTAIAARQGKRGHRRAPDRFPGLDPAGLRAGRDRDRGPGHHRPVPGRRGRGRRPGRDQPDDRLGRGLRGDVRDRGGRGHPAAARRLLGRAGRAPAAARRAAGGGGQQPVAGVVFVLDGVLIGAGDQDYLALAGLAAAGVFAAGAALVVTRHAGLVALWLVLSLWLAARFVTLILRARSSQWLVTGAVRR